MPRGVATDGLQLGGLVTQTDVKARWDDGSIRFAVVTALIPSEGSYDLTPGALSPPVGAPAVPPAEVRFSIYERRAVEISHVTNDSPTQVTTSEPHGLTTGEVIYINWSNSTPSLNGPQQVTVVDDDSFTIPVAVTRACPESAEPAFCPVMAGRFMPPQTARTDYVAMLPDLSLADPWLTGPHVSEGRSVVAPLRVGDHMPHAFLRVVFDTRVYHDGQYRIDTIVENVLDKAGARTVWYDVDVRVDGASRYTHAVGSLASAPVEHHYLTRWRRKFEGGGSSTSRVTPDLTPFQQARALPPYLDVADLPDGPDVPFEESPGYDILREGELRQFMPAHAGRQELAPFPDWAARYLVFKDQRRREIVLRHGDLSGSWPVHAREDESSPLSGVGPGRLPSLAQRPDLWFDARAEVNEFDFIRGLPLPVVESGREEPDTDQSGLVPDTAHQPSIAFIPYLLTGDRYYAEEMEFWANYSMLRTYNGDGDYMRGSDGILWANEVRGFGWALRNMADAAAYSPDAEVAAYLGHRVQANLDWLNKFVDDHIGPTNPFNVMWPSKFLRPENTEHGFAPYIAPWELSYLAHGIDRANAHGFTGGDKMLAAITNLRLLLFTSDPPYARINAAPVVLHIGDLWTDTFHQTLEELTAANSNPDYHRDFAGFYGPESRMDLMVAIRNGRPGAQDAYDYLWPFIGVDNTGCFFDGLDRPDLQCRAGWAVDFYPAAPGGGEGDPDGDGDGVPDAVDNCPATPNADQADFDGDTLGDACDEDDDGDGHSDAIEIAAGSNPLDPASTPEVCDGVDNDLNDGIDEGFADNDGDGMADCVDNDDDNDGRPDSDDPRPFVPNVAPAVDSPGAQTSTVGVTITALMVTATDEDGDDLTVSVDGLPTGVSYSTTTRQITGTPTAAGTFDVTVTASDGLEETSLVFTWTVEAKQTSLTLENPGAQTDTEGDWVKLRLKWSAPPKDKKKRHFKGPRFSATGLPRGLHISRHEGIIFGKVSRRGEGVYTVTVTLRMNDEEVSQTFQWTIEPKNHAPILKPGDRHRHDRVGESIRIVVRAFDRDDDDLTFTATGLPPGLTMSPGGEISGVIGGNGGDYCVVVTVSDGRATDQGSIDWTIKPPPKKKK